MKKAINDLSVTWVLTALFSTAIFALLTIVGLLFQKNITVPFGLMIGSVMVLVVWFVIGAITSEK